MFENKTPEQVFDEFSVDPEVGLSKEEAASRLAKNGPNQLKEKPKDPWYKILWGNIADPMTLILALAAIISLVLGIINITQGKVPAGEEWQEFMDVVIIFGVVAINAAIGTIQEMKAEKALEALKKMSAPKATVRRGGEMFEIPASELVKGDIVILEEGRTVPADLRRI